MNLLKYTMCASTVPYRLAYMLILCHVLIVVGTAAQYPDDSRSFVTSNGENLAQVSIDSSDASPNHNKNAKVADVGFVHAFIASFSVIIVSELGDKTFFIAAIMAMRNPRLTVFAGAILALALMTVLSVVFGLAAHIIPRVYTYYISTALFAIFGLKMLKDGCSMRDQDQEEELEDVQSDLKKREDEYLKSLQSGKTSPKSCSIELLPIATEGVDEDASSNNDNNNNKSKDICDPNDVSLGNGQVNGETGRRPSAQQLDSDKSKTTNCTENCESANRICNCKATTDNGLGSQTIGDNGSLQRLEKESALIDAESGVVRKTTARKGSSLMARIFMQAFTMTFVAEWGDRSQLTTIILGARENAYGVVIGGVIGHAICTGIAVIGGKMIAKKISVRTVTILGGFVFLLFAFSSLFFNPNDEESSP